MKTRPDSETIHDAVRRHYAAAATQAAQGATSSEMTVRKPGAACGAESCCADGVESS